MPTNLRDLADPRLRGRIALVHPGRGAGPVTLAALSLTYGEASADRFLRLLAANAPRLLATEPEVRAAVASGESAVGLTGSVEGAAGAASAHALRIVYPDQAGRGAVVLPTAVALLSPPAGGAPPEGAARLAAWLVGPEAERVLVARVPGLLPLRPDVPVPVGVEPRATSWRSGSSGIAWRRRRRGSPRSSRAGRRAGPPRLIHPESTSTRSRGPDRGARGTDPASPRP